MNAGNMDVERWKSLSLMEQMANIGSEVGRTAKWKRKANSDLAESAFRRALDLFDLTLEYGRLGLPLRDPMLRELCRAREYFCGAYEESDLEALTWLEKYFGYFAMAWRRGKG